MQIQDDGRGFNQDVLTDRNGLQNMRMRVTKWKGDLKINSSPGAGTSVEVSMYVKTSLLK
jgi:signal transduction histidine kinase